MSVVCIHVSCDGSEVNYQRFSESTLYVGTAFVCTWTVKTDEFVCWVSIRAGVKSGLWTEIWTDGQLNDNQFLL